MDRENKKLYKSELKRLMHLFEGSFINADLDLILKKKNNLYINLDNCETPMDLDIKMLCIVSREVLYDEKLLKVFNRWFYSKFSIDDINLIYVKLGNYINIELAKKFIKSYLDIELLI